MKHKRATLDGGVLFDAFEKVRRNFYENIDEKVHASSYEGPFTVMFAEPEFTGKFMDICAYYYETEGNIVALNKGMAVVDSIRKNIRDDGYLGRLEHGNEKIAFLVWNQLFTIYGLTRMWEATGDKTILELAEKGADWIMKEFSGENFPNIIKTGNGGTQHICLMFAFCRLFTDTGKQIYLDYVKKVLDFCETTDLNLISFKNILEMRSRKGIEMLVIYLGILNYGCLTGDNVAVDAAKRYWEQVNDTQIRNTGNGTVREVWTENGNAPRLMPTDEKPNETCVAVGWMELSMALFHVDQQAKYLDAIEKTLFNHMIGSLDRGGRDFAYYQGNYGRKIFKTDEGLYQCCRYRGFTIISYLKDYIWYGDENKVIPMVYTDSTFTSGDLEIVERTKYPTEGKIDFQIKNKGKNMEMKLRIPTWCKDYSVSVNQSKIEAEPEAGYITVILPNGETKITLELKLPIICEKCEIDGKRYVSYRYGVLLLAMDTHWGNELFEPVSGDAVPKQVEAEESMVHFICDSLHLIDFASAGTIDVSKDLYTVFIPEKCQ